MQQPAKCPALAPQPRSLEPLVLSLLSSTTTPPSSPCNPFFPKFSTLVLLLLLSAAAMQPTSQGWRLSLLSSPGRWRSPAGKTTGDPRAEEQGNTGRLGCPSPVQSAVWVDWLHESFQGPDGIRLCCTFQQHPPTWWVFLRPSK